VLQDLGYRTRQAADGRAALDMLRGPESFDLLFTDTVMPNGIGGHELIRLSREIRPGLKALLTSGHDPEVTAAHKAADGSVPMLSKPYRREALASAVRAALSAKPRG
jgi:CheY-like chemotaxis protein